MASDLVDGVWSEVRETTVLEVAPEQLHGVEFGGVGRKPDDVPARMRGQPRAHELVLVRVAAVPDQDDGPAYVTREMAEKPQACGPRMFIRGYSASARVSWRRRGDTTSAPMPETFSCERARGHRRRRSAPRPRASEHRHHQKAGLIETDQVGAAAREFFLLGASPAGSTRVRDDRRAPSRAAGAAAD